MLTMAYFKLNMWDVELAGKQPRKNLKCGWNILRSLLYRYLGGTR